MTGWGKVIYFLIYVAINEIGNYLDQDSKYYTCPCYCNIEHGHIRRDNDRCEQAFQVAIQDTCNVYALHYNDICRVDSSSYSDSSESLSLRDISVTK